ncbi:MAG: LuxR C-terminal-related transcriptional regulator [Slackia sp.]|nr:LuxR C-terminal-related transcriptional regulator [Slackia sp.]
MSDANIRDRRALALAAAIVGYALFRAANSSIYLSRFALADGSFIFMTDQAFNVASSLAVVICAGAVALLCAFKRPRPFSMPVVLPCAILAGSIAAVHTPLREALSPDAVLVLPTGAFALGSIMIKLSWIEVFSHSKPTSAIAVIGCGSIVSAPLQYAFTCMPQTAGACSAIAALIASAALLMRARRDAARHSFMPQGEIADRRTGRRKAFAGIGDALLALCALEAVIGAINSFMLAASMQFAGSDVIPALSVAIASALFCLSAFAADRLPAASTLLRMAFPVIAAMVVFVPFASDGYSRLFSTLLLASYDFVAVLVVYQVSQVARACGVSSYGLFAWSAMCAKASLLAALMAGNALGGPAQGEASPTMRFLVLSCGVIYVLAMAVLLFSRSGRGRNATDEKRCDANGAAAEHEGESADESFECTLSALSEQRGLTRRESEVLGYLARGRTNTYIAEKLCISPATVRAHIRNIYTKLDIHDRQELIDLFQQ